MARVGRWGRLAAAAACLSLATAPARAAGPGAKGGGWEWAEASPESQGVSAAALAAAWDALRERHTTALLVVRHDRIVFERYAAGYDRHRPHYTASMAKALVGGLALLLATADGRIRPDDPAGKYVPRWRDDPTRAGITVRHLATHTSGVEDAEADGLPHDRLTGWKGDFWKRLPPPRDPFTLARDEAPVMEPPGTRERYSNPGMALLGCCLTASLRGGDDPDIRSLLRRRVLRPLGVPDREASVGYGGTTVVDGLPLVATWGGGAWSPDAVARVGRLMLHKGEWEGRRLIDPAVVETAVKHAGMPGHSGLGWWVNAAPDGSKLWPSAPGDAFGGAGAGHQFLLVVPSLDLVVVRNGDRLDATLPFMEALERDVVGPVVRAVRASARRAPYPPSPVIAEVRWAPPGSILRRARGSDTWPMTWGDDDALYTAFGDGRGFDPPAPRKLSLGFARVTGPPDGFTGVNLPAPTGERTGDGAAGLKASGMLMVGGTLYAWVRNAGNARLAWSADRAKTWTWAGWKFTTGFGCPTFLNFGRDYAGARDGHVYVYSTDGDTAYRASDRMVLARVPRDRVRDRSAYEFFRGLDPAGAPLWSADVAARGAVFRHPGGCCRSSVSYDPGLKRYLWVQTLPGDARFRGGFGVYDAPEPWGPWTTAFFTDDWDVGPGETASFPTRWISPDGTTAHLVFSGDDCFSVRRADFRLADRPSP